MTTTSPSVGISASRPGTSLIGRWCALGACPAAHSSCSRTSSRNAAGSTSCTVTVGTCTPNTPSRLASPPKGGRGASDVVDGASDAVDPAWVGGDPGLDIAVAQCAEQPVGG